MPFDSVRDFLDTAFNGCPTASDELARHSRAGRELTLHQLEDRIVFSAELQSLIPIDSADISGGTDLIDYFAAMVEVDSAGPVDADLPPQAALAAAAGSTLAFPEAAGFGAYAQGGRGGDVYHVTNLNDNGPGSLRAGIETMTGPRTIVFDVGGNIELASRLTINHPYLTIAGQTAPGDGITIANHTLQIENTHDVIVRYIRMRAGDEDIANSEPATHDSFAIRWSQNVIADHVSVSWGIDETLAMTSSESVTVQWSIVSESLSDSYHPKGQHGLASLSIGGSLSLHNNLYAHHDFRMPHLAEIRADVVNNVFYDWRSATPSSVGEFNGAVELSYVNFENNVYIAGPSLDPDRAAKYVFWALDASEVWASGNVVDTTVNGNLDLQAADFSLSPNSRAILIDSRFDYPVVPSVDPLVAYESILDSAGSSLRRDAVDTRVVQEVINQTGRVIDSQTEVGGFPNLANASAPIDTDQDGMPDTWEQAFEFLDPTDPEDRNGDADGDGYTNLEEYLNRIAQSRQIPGVYEPEQDSISLPTHVFVGQPAPLVFGPGRAGTAYEIDWNGDSRADQTVNARVGTVVGHYYDEPGQYQVRVQTVDQQRAQFAYSQTIHVDMPTFAVSVAGPSITLLNQSESFDIDVSSSFDDDLTIEIDWSGNLQIDESIPIEPGEHVVSHTFRKTGDHMISVFLSHDGEHVSTENHHVFVVAPPALSTPAAINDLSPYDYHVMRRFLNASSRGHADDDDTTGEDNSCP